MLVSVFRRITALTIFCFHLPESDIQVTALKLNCTLVEDKAKFAVSKCPAAGQGLKNVLNDARQSEIFTEFRIIKRFQKLCSFAR